ncbi:MAG: 2-oxoacid:acceptor oxidoreductase family protein [Metallosphaera sp.]|uniref:2-oxoacid:acceptor oxidoreductase family protein n=1 Tax=Metallosphaera TaxID=41980 RepID=UPI00064E67B7|nr:2-oxoacid:acceptor oxidoreductase family protein [Metallosphaera cuprina]
MEKLNILIAGIGGQGVVTTGRMIAEVFNLKGYKVFEAETHGLAQRGGAVNVHVRIGDVNTPLIPMGKADILISLEATEALRNIQFLSKEAKIFLNTFTKPASLPNVKAVQVSEVVERLRNWQVFQVDCEKIHGKCNSVMLGCLYQASLKQYVEVKDFLSVMKDETNRNSFLSGLKYFSQAYEQEVRV